MESACLGASVCAGLTLPVCRVFIAHAGSHWEERILETEIMAPVVGSNKIHISPMTLATFEDSGWYTANYSMTGSYIPGDNLIVCDDPHSLLANMQQSLCISNDRCGVCPLLFMVGC